MKGCHWPLWPNGAPPDGRYCGAARTSLTSPYCAIHRRIACEVPGKKSEWVPPRKESGLTMRRAMARLIT